MLSYVCSIRACWVCLFPLPLGVWEGLWLVIVALTPLTFLLYFSHVAFVLSLFVPHRSVYIRKVVLRDYYVFCVFCIYFCWAHLPKLEHTFRPSFPNAYGELTHICRLDSLRQMFWQVHFEQKGRLVIYELWLCFVEIRVLKAESVDPDQTPRSVASDLDLHCLRMSLLCGSIHLVYFLPFDAKVVSFLTFFITSSPF